MVGRQVAVFAMQSKSFSAAAEPSAVVKQFFKDQQTKLRALLDFEVKTPIPVGGDDAAIAAYIDARDTFYEANGISPREYFVNEFDDAVADAGTLKEFMAAADGFRKTHGITDEDDVLSTLTAALADYEAKNPGVSMADAKPAVEAIFKEVYGKFGMDALLDETDDGRH